MRTYLYAARAGLFLLTCTITFPSQAQTNRPATNPPINLLTEFRPIGGTANNLSNPGFNAIPGSPERHLAPMNFGPGPNNPLISGPNPRTISNVIAGGTGASGQNSDTPDPRASAWIYVFGQFVDHDLGLETSPTTNAAINIPIPPNDPTFAGPIIAMTRDKRSPTTNTIINTTAGYLDLSQLYGSTVAVAASLRNPDGTLKTSTNGRALSVSGDYFVAGDPRVMENPELTAVTILFMREHNRWVGLLRTQHPNWSGDQLYDMARAITVAEYQNVVYNEYLPVLIGSYLGPYRGYNARVNAQVSQEFTTAAFRVGHTEVSEEQSGVDNNGLETFSESLAQAFFNTATEDLSNGIDPLLRSLHGDFSEATDVYTVPTLRNLLFAGLVGGNIDQVDLIAIDIQRERDVGIGSLNQVRRALGLRPYASFAELTRDPVLQNQFQSLYGNIDNVDLFMGGQAESHVGGGVVGATFQKIIGDQFEALRTGDRFFWLNQGFDRNTAAMIAGTSLSDILLRNTDSTSLPARVFVVAPNTPVRPHRHHSTNINNHGRRGVPFILP